jgi:hypothetical protein
MSLAKPLDVWVFDDIKKMKEDAIPESDLLDYKTGLVDDDSLIRHVTAFANSRGGFIVFGVEESGRGGTPIGVPGIETAIVNKERMEQLLLSNISPRLQTKFNQIAHETTGRCVLVLQVPDSALKPHMNLRTRKYYRRFEFESVEMEEREVSDAYIQRFSVSRQVDDYLAKQILRKNSASENCSVLGQIAVIPTNLNIMLLDTSDEKSLSWLDPNKIDPQPSGYSYAPKNGYLGSLPRPSAKGVICELTNFVQYLQLHRNGCVEYERELAAFAQPKDDPIEFAYVTFALKLLHTLQFATMVYSRYNYFGDVRVIGSIRSSRNLKLGAIAVPGDVYVERELSLTVLESRFSYIASGIMNELVNHFGQWRCKLFDEKGNYLPEAFRV